MDDERKDRRPEAGEIEERSSEALHVDGRRIRGVVPYGIESRDMGGWKEIIEPTAFHDTRFDELRAVIDHRGVPLATYPRTLDIENRSDGLHWSFDPPKSRADVVEAVERGDMRAGSWRMKVAKDRWDGDTRHVEAISDLYDVTLVAAELPAYPAAAVEYRSNPNPAEGQEEPMANEAEHQTNEQPVEQRSTSGGLNVEDRVEVIPTIRPFFEEVAIAAREVSVGEVRSLATTISLSNPEYSTTFFDALRGQSAFLRSGVRALTTSSDTVIYPQLASDPTIGWVSEAGTISASDPGLTSGTAIPHKLAVRVEYSNELVEDSSPGIEQILRQVLVARAGIQLDIAAFQGSGAAPEPLGMGNVSGITTVNAAGAGTSIAWAGSAVAALEANYAPRPYVWTSGTALVKNLRNVKAGSAVDSYMFLPTSEDLPVMWGARGYLAASLAAGTAYVYSPSSCYVVNRTQGFDIEVNRARLFDSDRSEMRLRARLDYFWPYPGTIARGTGVP